MGFFSDVGKTFEKATGVSPGRAATAGATFGLSEINFKALEAGGFDLGDPFGAGAAQAGLENASAAELEAIRQNIAFRERLLGETAPFRKAALEALPQLQAEVNAPIGESPLFKRGLQAGVTGIQQNLAGFGLGNSSTAGLAIGELGASLTGQEVGRRQNLLAGLAGGGTTGLGLGLGIQQLTTGLQGRQAQTLADIGATRGAGSAALTDLLAQLGIAGIGAVGGGK